MTLIDLFFNCVVIYALGTLLRVIPGYSQDYFQAALGFYLLKTLVWLGLRIPLMLPIDRWEKRGSPPEDNDPALVRAIYYFPFDFTIFYGALLGVFYAAFMAWLVYGPGPIKLGQDLMFPGFMLAGSVCAGAIAIGVPVNLLLTARLSRRLAERKTRSFDDIPGKELSLGAKMATIALALGCAPSLLLFSVQTFVQDHGLYQEATRSADAVMKGLAGEPPESFSRWVLSDGTYPFWVQQGRIGFAGSGEPPAQVVSIISSSLSSTLDVSYLDRQHRFVVRMTPRAGGFHGVVVRVPDPENHWLALSLVIMLASFWPLLTATLLVRTIVGPISLIASTFHRIIGRGRTEGTDRVPIFYKDEVGRLAFNANRTIDILTEARSQLEVTASNLAQKNQELEQAYRTKGEFLANMSHELRTPLNAIIGFSRLMKRKLGDTLPERQAKNLQMIEQSGEQLLSLVNDLLDFEKIEAGKLDVRRQEVELAPLLEGLIVTLEPMAAEKGLSLKVDLEGLPESIESDKERLRQVLTNLVTNAVKYSDHGVVTLKSVCEDDWVVFTITDQGIGMTPSQMERIFDPFHQVDASQTRERGGVGLGLAIVAKLVRLLRGRITVESEVGVGSTFTVRFPLGDGTSHLVPRGNGAEILVVDDNMDYLESIYGELTSAGFRVIAASSGQQALDILTTKRPSAILLDIVMPEMDGWEVLRRVRSQPDFVNIPVVITSVVNDRPVGLDVDFAGWLSKPFEFEELKRFLLADRVSGSDREGLVIVEDDPQTAQLLEQVFEDSGIRPAIFAGEAEAREHLGRSLPAVLILDLNLEEGSGWSVLTYLRSLPDSEKTRVFIYTASDLSSEEKARLSESFVTVVNKHGRDSLGHLVSSIVDKSSDRD
jgi:signal transduction histidine kinase/DNA-binding response OmpR family regulator